MRAPCRRCSSGSTSKADEPSSVRPIRVAPPLAKRSASATSVLPTPPCPTMATLRIFRRVVSSASWPPVAGVEMIGAPSSVRNSSTSSIVVDCVAMSGAEAARREHAALPVVLVPDARDEPVDQADVAVDDARLHRVDGVAADHARRPRDLDARELRGVRAQSASGEMPMPGAMTPPDVLALARVDAVEGGRGAEVDHDHRARVALVGGDRVDDAVGADLARVVVEDRHAGLDPGPDEQRLAPK